MTRILQTPALLSAIAAIVLAAGPVQAQYQVLEAEIGEARSDYYWAVEVADGEPTLLGGVPFTSIAEALNARAGRDDPLEIRDGAPRGFFPDALIALNAAGLLRDGFAGYGDTSWQISGTLADDADLISLMDIVSAPTGNGDPWVVELFTTEESDTELSAGADAVSSETLDGIESLFEEAPNGVIAPEASANQSNGMADEPLVDQSLVLDTEAPLDDANREGGSDRVTEPEATSVPVETGLEQCRQGVGALLDDRSVLFSSGSARLTADSFALVQDIAGVLAGCPETPVYVEGHTDADGGDRANLVLSLSRAEAVVDALVETGLLPRRLYAVGYGASLPIASNQTAAGKAQNRRIVFNFEDMAEQNETTQ